MDPKKVVLIVVLILLILSIVTICLIVNNKKEGYSDEIIVTSKLADIHKKLTLKYGTFEDEFPEQIMAYMFIEPSDIVLEIGANIGRNTLIISECLNDDRNLVALESDPFTAKQLEENKVINNKNFTIIPRALSKNNLIQKDWTCIPHDINNPIPEGYKLIDIIDLESIKRTLNKNFTVLVLDCEGAFYYILQDFPEILDKVKTIIMENDYNDPEHKLFINDILMSKGFSRVYKKEGGWGPCYQFFFETWKR
jgi:FkbM family methyltransferase